MMIQQMSTLVSSIIQPHKSMDSMREKTTDWNLYRWTSTDEQMFMFFLSPPLTRVEGTTESFKIMLRYFHLSAIKGDAQTLTDTTLKYSLLSGVWPLHLWIKVLTLNSAQWITLNLARLLPTPFEVGTYVSHFICHQLLSILNSL